MQFSACMDDNFAQDTPPPPVPRLVFAEDVDKRLKDKRSARDKDKSSERESYQSSDTERRSRRDRFEETLKGAQWNVGSSIASSSDSAPPSPTPLLPSPKPFVKRTPPTSIHSFLYLWQHCHSHFIMTLHTTLLYLVFECWQQLKGKACWGLERMLCPHWSGSRQCCPASSLSQSPQRPTLRSPHSLQTLPSTLNNLLKQQLVLFSPPRCVWLLFSFSP